MHKMHISTEMFSAFSHESVRLYEDKVVVHLRRLFKEQFNTLTEPVVRKITRYGIARSESYGFLQEDNTCSYIDMMFVYGINFDTELSWAASILADSSIQDPLTRADLLYKAALVNLHTAKGLSPNDKTIEGLS